MSKFYEVELVIALDYLVVVEDDATEEDAINFAESESGQSFDVVEMKATLANDKFIEQKKLSYSKDKQLLL